MRPCPGRFSNLAEILFLALCAAFFAIVAVIGPIAGGWYGLILTAIAGTIAWLLGVAAWEDWWENR